MKKSKNPIRLFWGENYSEKPVEVIKAIEIASKESKEIINLYPGELYDQATEVLAQAEGFEKDNIILGHGIEGLIHLTAETFILKGKIGGMFEPSFFAFNYNLEGKHHKKFKCHYQDKIDFSELKANINYTDLFFIASPNTATGSYLLSREQIEELLGVYTGILVIDECYYGLGDVTVLDLIDTYDNLMVYRGMTKVMGMGSLRLGMAFSSKEIIRKLNHKFRETELDPINTFSLKVLIYTYSYYVLLAKNAKNFMNDFLEFMKQEFPKDNFINNVTTFHFMDITRYPVASFEVVNHMNQNGYLFSHNDLDSNEKINYPEFIELTPPPREYWEDLSYNLKNILKKN